MFLLIYVITVVTVYARKHLSFCDQRRQLTLHFEQPPLQRLVGAGTGLGKDEIANVLSVTTRSITGYLSDIDKRLREERKQKIFDMWMACYSQEEIAQEINSDPTDKNLRLSGNLEDFPNYQKLAALHQDAEFTAPLYNIWTFSKKTNGVSRFDNRVKLL